LLGLSSNLQAYRSIQLGVDAERLRPFGDCLILLELEPTEKQDLNYMNTGNM